MHTDEPLILQPSSSDMKIAIENLKTYKSPGKGKGKAVHVLN
jgi:hypothetical protein